MESPPSSSLNSSLDLSHDWTPEPAAPPYPDAALHATIDHLLVIEDSLLEITGALCAISDDFHTVKALLEQGVRP